MPSTSLVATCSTETTPPSKTFDGLLAYLAPFGFFRPCISGGYFSVPPDIEVVISAVSLFVHNLPVAHVHLTHGNALIRAVLDVS